MLKAIAIFDSSGSGGVTTLNGETGAVTLTGSGGIAISTPSGSVINIDGSATQTPWTQNINGMQFHLFNALIYDAQATPLQSINPGQRRLFRNNGSSAAIDYSGNKNTAASISFLGSEIVLSQVIIGEIDQEASIDANNRNLCDGNGNTVVDWDDTGLYLADSTGSAAIEWGNRLLLDATLLNSLDWNNRQSFYQDGSTVSIDWGNSELMDSAGITSVDWQNRIFNNSSGIKIFNLTSTGMALNKPITQYNAINTVSNGVPAEYAQVNLTTQTAAIAATTAYTVPGTALGMYRISWEADITTAGTVSSTLGPFQITFVSPTGAVTKTTVASATSVANTTGTTLSGVYIVWAASSSAIQYTMGYAASAANSMAYELHIVVEKL